MQKRTLLLMLALAIPFVVTTSVLAQDLTCTECHNDTTVITGRALEWSETMHATGESYGRGTSRSCAGCHSGGAFSQMVAAGLRPDEVEAGDPHPTRQDCRACHQVHTSYTAADWALETYAPVTLYAFEDVTFDGGMGNLCANCHQPRRAIAAPDDDGNIEITSTHYGPHHGPQSAMLLGKGGAGDVAGRLSPHAALVEDTCVACHMGESGNHTFEANVAACTSCHPDAEDFDIGGVQAEVDAMVTELGEKLEAAGLIHDGHPNPGVFPAAQTQAAWNWIFISIEDGSLGVHNPSYTKKLLEESLKAME